MASAVLRPEMSPGNVVHTFHATVHAGIHPHSIQPRDKEAGFTAVQAYEPSLIHPLVSGFGDDVCLPGQI